MKALKYIGTVLLILALIFFGRGLLTPAVDYQNEVVVDATAEEAWAVISDESKLPEWIKGYKRSESVSGTPNTAGAVSNVYVEEPGQGEMVMQETITAIEPNKRMAMTFTMDFMDMDYELTMNEEGGKTRIQTNSDVRGNGLFSKSMISFMGGAMEGQEQENLENLKKVIEGN